MKIASNVNSYMTIAFISIAIVFLLLPGTAICKGNSSKWKIFSAKDKYVACVIGRAIIQVKNGMNSEKAQQIATTSCGTEPEGLSGDNGEGASDFINSVVNDFAEKRQGH